MTTSSVDHLPRGIAKAAKARSGLSVCVAAAVARRIERDNLDELTQVAKAEHGPIAAEEIQSLRDQLAKERHEQARTGACPT